jgi:hypothetical protein
MSESVLTNRALNRATLERQLLLKRSARSPVDATEHLVGLQSQNPLDPYLALWSRLEDFDPDDVGRSLEARQLVRIVAMRGTIHLLTADDARFLRPLTQPVLDAELARHSEFAPLLAGVDLSPVMTFAHALLSDHPMSGRELRAALAPQFPDVAPAALAYACRCSLALVQVPPRGVWGKTKQVTLAPLDTWVGRPVARQPSRGTMVRRYLAAFGPASVADIANWSRLTGLRDTVEPLRPQLRVFRSESGTELFDLPEAPRPDPDLPAPVRFLPEYDNLLLSHADRSRFSSSDGATTLAGAIGPFKGSVLVDGFVRGIWHFERDAKIESVSLVIEHARMTKKDTSKVESEARRVARFWSCDLGASAIQLRPIESSPRTRPVGA